MLPLRISVPRMTAYRETFTGSLILSRSDRRSVRSFRLVVEDDITALTLHRGVHLVWDRSAVVVFLSAGPGVLVRSVVVAFFLDFVGLLFGRVF